MPIDGVFRIGSAEAAPGYRVHGELELTQTYSGVPVRIPLCILRGRKPGPAVFVTGVVHGDELNGAGIVRALIADDALQLLSGALVLVPVMNLLGFDRKMRYLPDRRDLNRSFPGSANGSLAARYAHRLYQEIVAKCDFGIDLHTGASGRTNFPNVRGDLSDPAVRALAQAFGSEVIVDGKGPQGSLRRTATEQGKPVIILEAGEIWKVEPTVVEFGVRGVRSVLAAHGMIEGEPHLPHYQIVAADTSWLRADHGGLLQFHVSPGDVVHQGDAVATVQDLLGRDLDLITARGNGFVLGLTTHPSVVPGDPICHLAAIKEGLRKIERTVSGLSDESLHQRLRDDLKSNIVVEEREREGK